MLEYKQGSWPVEVGIDVAWGDMDAFAHVNNIVYLRWFETARIHFFERAGIMDRKADEKIGPILAKTSCAYLRPVTFPDRIWAATRCSRVGRSSFEMVYELRSEQLGELCATGDSVIVMVDYKTGRSDPLSDATRERLQSLM